MVMGKGNKAIFRVAMYKTVCGWRKRMKEMGSCVAVLIIVPKKDSRFKRVKGAAQR